VWLAILGIAGCNQAFGPERMETTRVTGRVHIQGKPVTGGWIEFMPIQGTVGRLRSGAVRSDGTFEADKVPVGRLGIRLPGPSLPGTGDPNFDAHLSKIRRDTGPLVRLIDVRPGLNPPIDIDLKR
jgi:hypothetical protein